MACCATFLLLHNYYYDNEQCSRRVSSLFQSLTAVTGRISNRYATIDGTLKALSWLGGRNKDQLKTISLDLLLQCKLDIGEVEKRRQRTCQIACSHQEEEKSIFFLPSLAHHVIVHQEQQQHIARLWRLALNVINTNHNGRDDSLRSLLPH